MAQEKKVLAVVGATGYQGGAVVQYFANLPSSPYSVRALTRDPTSDKSQALAKKYPNVSVVKADLSDVSSLKTALDGAHVAYIVTDFFGSMSAQVETQQAKNAFDILATSPTVEHVFWSALPSITDFSGGKFTHVLHFDSKATATKYLKEELPELWKKTTTLFVAGYMQIWSQMPAMFAPRNLGDDVWGISLPVDESITFPTVDVRDVGLGVDALLQAGTDKVGGKTASLFSNNTMSMSDMVKIWASHVGKKAGWQTISDEEFVGRLNAMGFPDFVVEDMSELFQALRELGDRPWQGEIIVKDILPEGGVLNTWDQFVKEANWDFILKAN